MAGKSRKSASTLVIREIGEASPAIDEMATDISEKKEKVKVEEPVIEEPKPITTPVEVKSASKEGVLKSGTVSANPWLNIRNEPNGALVIGKLDDGTKVDIYEIRKGFGKISATEEKWVNLEYVV